MEIITVIILNSEGDYEMKVKVYLEIINKWGDAIDSKEIGRFPDMDWARRFIEEVKTLEDEITRIRVEYK